MDKNEQLKQASGNVKYASKLTSFLYELMRDHLPFGEVEKIVRNSQSGVTDYSNGWLAHYANYLTGLLELEPPLSDYLDHIERLLHLTGKFGKLMTNDDKRKWMQTHEYMVEQRIHLSPEGDTLRACIAQQFKPALDA